MIPDCEIPLPDLRLDAACRELSLPRPSEEAYHLVLVLEDADLSDGSVPEDKWAEEVYEEMRDLISLYHMQRRLASTKEKMQYCLVCREHFSGSVFDHIQYHMMTSTPPPEFS